MSTDLKDESDIIEDARGTRDTPAPGALAALATGVALVLYRRRV